jgi:rfaE bifunctional protein kinase chain/domain/rfaE bifunctional protein nucleotidyltransferase chain/domain
MSMTESVATSLTPDVPARIAAAAPLVSVVGDYLLDGWWSGRIERVAREAPAPIVDILNREYVPGGAANTAMNLAALGARVRAVGLIGDDDEGRMLRGMLREAGIDVAGLLSVAGARTTTKYRVIAGEQLVVRLDDTWREQWPDAALDRLVAAAARAADGAAAEVVCDYGSAVLCDRTVDALAQRNGRAGIVVVDAHDPSRWRALAPDLITPNAAETANVLASALPADDRAAFVVANTDRLLAATGANAAVVTLDHEGAVLVRPERDGRRTYAHPALEKQASGAGDTFVAALTAASAAGFDLETAVDVAQSAADIAVRKPGTCLCTSAELTAWLGRSPDVAVDAASLAAKLDEHRGRGERIVFTNGCFDVLHRGHTSYLKQAKRLGDVLVVAINGNESVRRLKGPDRPINDETDRANVLAALSCVDYVTIFDDDTPRDLIARLRPDVYAKGGDYTPEMLPETDIVRAVGGEVAILDYVPEHSTSGIVQRIRQNAGAGSPARPR